MLQSQIHKESLLTISDVDLAETENNHHIRRGQYNDSQYSQTYDGVIQGGGARVRFSLSCLSITVCAGKTSQLLLNSQLSI